MRLCSLPAHVNCTSTSRAGQATAARRGVRGYPAGRARCDPPRRRRRSKVARRARHRRPARSGRPAGADAVRPRRPRAARLRDAPARPARARCGLACWWNLFQFHYPGFAHPSDTFHYYLGAKYFPELGYTRLYECVAVADAEAGSRRRGRCAARCATSRRNELTTTAAAIAAPGALHRALLAGALGRLPARRRLPARPRARRAAGSSFQQDHGYNATPAWTLRSAIALTDTGPASPAQLARAAGRSIRCCSLAIWARRAAGPSAGASPRRRGLLRHQLPLALRLDRRRASCARTGWRRACSASALLARERPAPAARCSPGRRCCASSRAALLAGVALGALWRMARERSRAPAARRAPLRRRCGWRARGRRRALERRRPAGLARWREFAERQPRAARDAARATTSASSRRSPTTPRRAAQLGARPLARRIPMQRLEGGAARALRRAPPGLFAPAGRRLRAAARARGRRPAALGRRRARRRRLIPVALELTGYYWSVCSSSACSRRAPPRDRRRALRASRRRASPSRSCGTGPTRSTRRSRPRRGARVLRAVAASRARARTRVTPG